MHEIVMPKLGNTVESVIIVEWRKEVGEQVNIGEALCEVETDKSTVEVEAEEAGILLARLFDVGDEVPVLGRFAVLGEEGEDVSALFTSGAADANESEPADARRHTNGEDSSAPGSSSSLGAPPEAKRQEKEGSHSGISPRAWKLALRAGLGPRPLAGLGAAGAAPGTAAIIVPDAISGTGPGGRIIERDVDRVLATLSRPGADSKADFSTAPDATSPPGIRMASATSAPTYGTASAGSGRESTAHTKDVQSEFPGAVEVIPLKGVRKNIASRMRASLSGTAQLTLNSSAPAGSILAWHRSFKSASIGRKDVSINHLLMLSVARLLPHHPELNATFHGNEIRRYSHVHLGFAVDTAKGLMTPVIRNAGGRSLDSLTAEAGRLAEACREGHISPDELVGSTFTVTNLGALGIESFTPVLNAPEVAILGIGAITNAPIEAETGIEKRIGLSLTIDHQAVDGATGARFLAQLARLLAKLELVAVL